MKRTSVQILILQAKIYQLMNDHVSKSTSPEDLDLIKQKMKDTIEQGNFWIKQKNPKRFLYELENLYKWAKSHTSNETS
jgi:hypothetical protein